ncbi:hypothetical protein [Mesorhizobium sp. B2-4-7]|uniref:hypothetical protein n=1 Tax=Mesorhizobium sp. B2-4-7 TaxID=2589942 RepID=UPI0011290127|nr:hypothetical protein [Mesorhizobium sp. B2-4-7]TPL30196.1 hypothetical protein FJ946_02705 [Mesorhizobium sp. B2-4-7]
MMTVLQAAAAVTLWRSGRFDTLQIAQALGGGMPQSEFFPPSEADVCRLLHASRGREHGPDLHLVRAELSLPK